MLTIKEVAKKMGLSGSAVYKMIREQRAIGKQFYYVPGLGYRCDFKEDEK